MICKGEEREEKVGVMDKKKNYSLKKISIMGEKKKKIR